MMTKNNITTRSYLKTALIIPIFLMLGVTFGCNPMNPQQKQNASKIQQAITPSNITPPGESQTGKSLKNIDVKLIGLQTIKIDGKVVSFSASKAVFTSLLKKHPNSIISIKAGKNTPKGLLTKLQHILQQAGALRINYSVTQPKGHSRHKSQRLTLNQRNILKLYVNGAGDIFANQTRTPLSSVKGLVEKFITNNGKVSNLSESPQKAIISIKIDKTAPYDVYINMVQKAVDAYDDLRNKASEKLFAKPFQSLKKGSKQRIKIENMYPKQISIAMPSKG